MADPDRPAWRRGEHRRVWFAPFLGAIMMIGTFGGLLVAVLPASVERVAAWLSGAPLRRRK